MQRLIITADGDYKFSVPLGREFSLAASGVFSGATLTAQYNSGIAGVKAMGTLTGTTIADGDTVDIEDDTYTFKTALSVGPAVPNEVLVGVSDSASLDNLIAAVNGAAGEGTTYGTGTVAHVYVDAFAGAGDTMVVKAKEVGVYGLNITTTSSLTAGTWAAVALTGGEDAEDRYAPFGTTALALTAAGEKFGVNVGAQNEININVASATANFTEVVVVLNVMALQERGR